MGLLKERLKAASEAGRVPEGRPKSKKSSGEPKLSSADAIARAGVAAFIDANKHEILRSIEFYDGPAWAEQTGKYDFSHVTEHTLLNALNNIALELYPELQAEGIISAIDIDTRLPLGEVSCPGCGHLYGHHGREVCISCEECSACHDRGVCAEPEFITGAEMKSIISAMF